MINMLIPLLVSGVYFISISGTLLWPTILFAWIGSSGYRIFASGGFWGALVGCVSPSLFVSLALLLTMDLFNANFKGIFKIPEGGAFVAIIPLLVGVACAWIGQAYLLFIGTTPSSFKVGFMHLVFASSIPSVIATLIAIKFLRN